MFVNVHVLTREEYISGHKLKSFTVHLKMFGLGNGSYLLNLVKYFLLS